MTNKKRLIRGIFLSLVFILFFGFFISGLQVFFKTSLDGHNRNEFLGSISGAVADTGSEQNQNISPDQEKFQEPEIEVLAESAVAIKTDLNDDKVIFEKDKNLKLPIASLTKLMTAIICLDNYDLLQNVTVSKKADLQEPMHIDLKEGDVYSVIDLLYITLIESSNKAAYALSEQMGEEKFIAEMNKKAVELGLENTFYADPTGLSSENISTVGDLAKLIKYILKNYPEIAEISRTKEYEISGFGKIENTNQLLGEVPEIVCGKTGFTTDAKGCLILTTYDESGNDYFVYVILGAEDRFLEMKKLINKVAQWKL